jgi:hypothetical protein
MKILRRWVKSCMYYTLDREQSFLLPIKGKYYNSQYINLIEDGILTVCEGYSWNGCSPKFEIFDVIIGTPEGVKFGQYSKTYFPSLVHDILYQIRVCPRKKADQIFLDMMRSRKFKLAYLYYIAVRLFGKNAWGK